LSEQSNSSYQFGHFHLDTRNRLLLRDGVVVPLTPKVFDTLMVLVENCGRVVEKELMMNQIWPDSFVEERNLAQNIFTLRKALGEEGPDKYIETIPKRGYRFVAAVKLLADEDADMIVAKRVRSKVVIDEEILDDSEPVHSLDKKQLAAEQAATKSLKTRWLIGGLALAAVGAALYLIFANRATQPVSIAGVKSIAVLPFKIITTADSDNYLGLGMADALITRLSRLRQIIVRPTRAVLKYDTADQDPLAVGRELRVDSLLDGTIQRNGERLRLTVQLFRVSDGASLWADTFDEQFTDIFAVQDSIADRVTQAMLLRLTGEEKQQLTKRYTRSTEAYQSYVKGRYFWNKRTEAGLRQAKEYFDQALERDPGYALAYVGLAECYALYSTYGVMPAREAFPRAQEAAERALEIDEQLAEAHASLGVVRYEYNWDWPGADKEFRRALELAPSYATAHQWYGGYLIALGAFDDGIREIKRAQELDPLSPVMNASVGWFYYFARQYDKAIEEGRKATDLESGSAIAHFFLGQAYMQKGMHTEAVAELQKSLNLAPDEPGSIAVLVHAHMLAGDKEEANRFLARLIDLSKRAYVPPYNIAEAYVGVRDRDQAFFWLDKAFEEHSPDLVGLKTEPRLDSLRSDPRFADLIRRVGFAP
jgi:DNA-binding winged helix-turn-helix (wHTH) protein/TolB-like protein/Tfp pilus assembly protein PilF